MKTPHPFVTFCLCTFLMAAFPLSVQPARAQESTAETIPVPKIVFAITDKTFPSEWLKAPTFAHAKPIPVSDENRSIRAVRRALSLYPPRFLAANLNTVYVVSHLSMERTTVGASSSEETKSLYINNDGEAAGYTDIELEGSVHHTLANILMANHPEKFSAKLWEGLNDPGFHYGKGWLEWIKSGRSGVDGGQPLEERFLERGFIQDYATSEVGEDFACTAEALLTGSQGLWATIDRYPVVKKKAAMVIAFYQSLDKTMTEGYFRRLEQPTLGQPIRYFPGDLVLFPDGGFIISPGINGGSSLRVDIPAGSSAVYPAGGYIVFNPHKP